MLDLHDDVSDQLINKYPGTWLKLYTLKDYANEKQDLLFSEPCEGKAFDYTVDKRHVVADKLSEKIDSQFDDRE